MLRHRPERGEGRFLKFVNTTANANFAWYRFVPRTTGTAAPSAWLASPRPSIEIAAFDLEGRRVRSFQAQPDQTPVQAWAMHGKDLPAGTYVLRIKHEAGVRSEIVVQPAVH